MRRIHAELPKTRILVLSRYSDRDHILLNLHAGADGYLVKSAPTLVTLVRYAVNKGLFY